MTSLVRRGFSLGEAPEQTHLDNAALDRWHDGLPVVLRKQCASQIKQQLEAIRQTEYFVTAVLEGQECDELLAQPPYAERLEKQFQSLGAAYNEGDEQEIEMVLFDAIDGDALVAEDLWMKASWLSFHDDDASLRFRFSFGIDHEQDVAADPKRQQLAATLTDAVFPESCIITDDSNLLDKLETLLGSTSVQFVERIIYFNAPNGGAYLHHDLERGHAGVVFAQLSGSTFWLALPKSALVQQVIRFAELDQWPASMSQTMIEEVNFLATKPTELADELGNFANDTLIHLINETEAFVQHLIEQGYGHQLNPGDVILLPQATSETCCWHSVFCLGDEIGQALSFAIR